MNHKSLITSHKPRFQERRAEYGKKHLILWAETLYNNVIAKLILLRRNIMKTQNKGENAGRAVKILIVCAILVLSAASQLQAAENKDFYGNGQILAGEQWNVVSIYDTLPSHTTVDMYGGTIDSLGAYDQSSVNIYDGHINGAHAGDYSTINAFGGSMTLAGTGHGTINVYGGDFLNIGGGYNSVINMSSGTTEYLGAGDFGIINLSGGLVTDSLYGGDSSVVNIFGYNLTKTPYGGRYDFGQVSGVWADGVPFEIDLRSSTNGTYSHINLIPEPMTLLLIGFGTLFVRKRRQSRCLTIYCQQ